MSFTLVTVTANELSPEAGKPVRGQVTATLMRAMKNGTVEVAPTPVVGAVNDSGELVLQSGKPFQLPATDDAGTEPSGVGYEWRIELGNARSRTFFAPLPHATNPVDLSALAPNE